MTLDRAATPAGPLQFHGWGTKTMDQAPPMDEFRRRHPAVELHWTGYPVNEYADQIVPVLAARRPPVDALLVRETHVGAWAQRGFLRPLEGLDFLDVQAIKAAASPAAIADGTVDGRLYGVPYYHSWTSFAVNVRILGDAGFSAGPTTFDELATQLHAIRRTGLVEAPMSLPLASSENWLEIPALVHASGGRMFDEDGNPVFDRPGSVAAEVIERLAALLAAGLIDPRSLEMVNPDSRDGFMAGRVAMSTVSAQYFALIRDPVESPTAADTRLADLPSLAGSMLGTVGFTRLYSVAAKARNPGAAGALLQFLSGRDQDGTYWNQEYMLLTAGTLSAYPEVLYGPRCRDRVAQWFGDLDLAARQQAGARPRDAQDRPWYPDWDRFHQACVRRVLLGLESAADALRLSADEARRLRRASARAPQG